MRMTLLEMVQEIASALVSDSVSSVTGTGATEEGTIIAGYIKSAYYEILDRQEWSFLQTVGLLDALVDLTKPNYLVAPTSVKQITTVRYDVSETTTPDMRDVTYKTPEDFIAYMYSNRSVDLTITNIVTDYSGIRLLIRNDRFPKYYTSFDDKHLVFDSYHSTYDTTLQSSKSMATLITYPSWTVSNTFVPFLPEGMFSLLVAEAKDASFQYLRQTQTAKDNKRVSRHSSHARHASTRVIDKAPRQGFGRI